MHEQSMRHVSLAIEMKTRHLLRVEFSIKKVSSRVFLKTIWRFLIDLLVN